MTCGSPYLLELALACADDDLPAIIHVLVHPGRVLVLHIEIHIILERFDGQPLAVQEHLQAHARVPDQLDWSAEAHKAWQVSNLLRQQRLQVQWDAQLFRFWLSQQSVYGTLHAELSLQRAL